jgi:hypothetical protein
MPGFRGVFRSEQYYYHDRKPCVKYFRKNSSLAFRIHIVSFVQLFTFHCKGRILALGFLDMIIIFFMEGIFIPFAGLRSAGMMTRLVGIVSSTENLPGGMSC